MECWTSHSLEHHNLDSSIAAMRSVCVCVCVCLGVIRKQKKSTVGYLSVLSQVCQTKISIFIIFYMLV